MNLKYIYYLLYELLNLCIFKDLSLVINNKIIILKIKININTEVTKKKKKKKKKTIFI